MLGVQGAQNVKWVSGTSSKQDMDNDIRSHSFFLEFRFALDSTKSTWHMALSLSAFKKMRTSVSI